MLGVKDGKKIKNEHIRGIVKVNEIASKIQESRLIDGLGI
jgi:hypothetical protein